MTPQKRKKQDRKALHALFLEHARTRDPALREQLAIAHTNLAVYLARKFANRGEPLEDIIQVAHIGLLKAIDRFDPSRGIEFTTYGTATIVGEIKRHFRDKFWAVHVPRRLRELNNLLMRTVDPLGQRLGRSPTIVEIAKAAKVQVEDAIEAFEVGRAYSVASLDAYAEAADDQASSLMESLGEEDPELTRAEDHYALERALQHLPERHREIVHLRYYQGISQAEIAKRLGISQMHVSRIQRDALLRLRTLVAPSDRPASSRPK